MATMIYDVAIVGAGAAGLGAARAARDRGLSYVVLEAAGRSGGRAHTETSTFGFAWDRGCHWLHSASINPMRELADEYGFRYAKGGVSRGHHLGDRWASPEEEERIAGEMASTRERVTATGARGLDVSASEVVDMTSPWLPVVRTAYAGEWSVDVPDVSTADDAAYRDTAENWPLEDGYGALVQRHAEGIEVQLSTPVERISWGGPSVKLATPSGQVEARAVIVTVSTRVLQDEVIAFDPPLPSWKREAYQAIQLGNANKVSFALPREELGVPEEGSSSAWAKVDDRQGIWFQLGAFGRGMANGYIGGALGLEVERAGEAAMLATGRDALARMYGSDVGGKITAEACSMWSSDPWVRGAYGAARPGKAHLRADLATPVGEQLFFAGEATSLDWFSTCHGAHLSGIAAVEAVAEARETGGVGLSSLIHSTRA